MLRPVYTRSLLLLLLRIWSVNSKWPTRRAAPTFFFSFSFFLFLSLGRRWIKASRSDWSRALERVQRRRDDGDRSGGR
jgi:hypothetical protein